MPCIAARTTAIADYFGDAMVEFFEPGNVDDLARAIRDLHADPDRRAALADRAANFTGRHSWSREGAAFVELIDSLAGRRATKDAYQAIPR